MTDEARGPVADHPHAVLAEDSAPHGGPPSAPPRPQLVADWRFKHIWIPASRRWSATILILIIPGIYILWIAYPR